MKRETYIDNILQVYSLVTVLSQKNGCKVLRLRNKNSGKTLILRSLPNSLEAYRKLLNIRCENPQKIEVVLQNGTAKMCNSVEDVVKILKAC
jgi:hypothetical protein